MKPRARVCPRCGDPHESAEWEHCEACRFDLFGAAAMAGFPVQLHDDAPCTRATPWRCLLCGAVNEAEAEACRICDTGPAD